jgi:hypothetical protein
MGFESEFKFFKKKFKTVKFWSRPIIHDQFYTENLPILGGQKVAVSDLVEGWCAAGNIVQTDWQRDDRDGWRDGRIQGRLHFSSRRQVTPSLYLATVRSHCPSGVRGRNFLPKLYDVGMRNEASPESVRPVILPLSIRPVVHADGHPGSSEIASCTPSLCWVWHCSFLPTKNGKEINQEWNNNNLRWWCCCCRNVAS